VKDETQEQALDLARAAWREVDIMRLAGGSTNWRTSEEQWRSVLDKLAWIQKILQRDIKGVK
jgi:hypothetical protein